MSSIARSYLWNSSADQYCLYSLCVRYLTRKFVRNLKADFFLYAYFLFIENKMFSMEKIFSSFSFCFELQIDDDVRLAVVIVVVEHY